MFGPDHADTLLIRLNLARSRGRAGNPVGAVAAFEELSADFLRLLGPDHRDTFVMRHNFADARGKAEGAAVAVAAFVVLLSDMRRVLRADNPQVAHAEVNLEYWRERANE
ncbi:hypothetical protein [Amycolatopsis sp. CA-128772]|uniref:hypothetical protein n=1 Tax=Amycolatopsis sp. CA-128772 TaxID=2073159 RepID=UPI0018EBB7C2|nr:hypothetical protein [Amycolatopsis sp. CA-128772]